MQIRRKTNLFNIYKDNKFCAPQFVTFSNYAESMTGNSLSVNTKMFPSGFICLDIPKLSNDNEEYANTKSFYKDCLVAHYENKMAFLRDYVTDIDTKNHTLDELKSLDYLLRSIKQFDSTSNIVHIGDIVEQNYNGIYSDMLLTINVPEYKYTYNINSVDTIKSPVNYHTYVGETNNNLYGWYKVEKEDDNISYIYNGPSTFNDTNIILDDENYYYIGNKYDKINIVKTNGTEPLKFNVIIPLFNIYNIDETVSNSNNGITSNKDNNIDLSICDNDNYIPYGIWFSGTNNYVTLNRNTNIDTYEIIQPSWSLVLSSQFSAFPYSSKYSTNAISNNTTDKSFEKTDTKYIDVYHNTFASILTEQSNLIDLLYKQNKEIADIRKELDILKSRIK